MQKQYTANLPQLAYSAQQVKQYEGQAASDSGLTLSQLMTSAGSAVAELVANECRGCSSALVLTGKGNNGGDGFIAATRLKALGWQVCVLPLDDPEKLVGDAGMAYRDYRAVGGRVADVLPDSGFDVVVDAVLGTGFRGALPEHYRQVFTPLNRASLIRVSIDVPSGVDATTGEVADGAFFAHHTVTFIALKQGLLSGSARAHCGRLWFAGLGVEKAFAALVQPLAEYPDREAYFALRPTRSDAGYKNKYGHVLVVAGSSTMAGAARLAAEACLRSGAGLVSVATHPDNVSVVLAGRYELMVHGVNSAEQLAPLIEKASVIVLGPGLGQGDWGRTLWSAVLAKRGARPVVMDADGLNLLAESPRKLDNAVLTPHSGEAARLLARGAKEIEQNRFQSIAALGKKYGATWVLKGPGSLVSDGVSLNINRSGCGAMASAGMGDVLSGMIGALLAQGLAPYEAARLAVYLHGAAAQKAAEDGEVGLVAGDLFKFIRWLLG